MKDRLYIRPERLSTRFVEETSLPKLNFYHKKDSTLESNSIIVRKMDDDELMGQQLNHHQRLIAVGKKLTDIGDELDRSTRKENYFSYGSWMCIVTALLTIGVYCLPTKYSDTSYL